MEKEIEPPSHSAQQDFSSSSQHKGPDISFLAIGSSSSEACCAPKALECFETLRLKNENLFSERSQHTASDQGRVEISNDVVIAAASEAASRSDTLLQTTV